MRIAAVHDWLITYAGSERAFEQILKAYPSADVFTLIDKLSPKGRGFILDKPTVTSFLQYMPGIERHYRKWLPLMPLAAGRMDLTGYDLVISSCHAVSKGVRTSIRSPHLCYCYTPIRYAWDLMDDYLRDNGLDRGLMGAAARRILTYVREWDLEAAGRVTAFAAISEYIAERIRRNYGRRSVVIHPPVDTEFYTPGCGTPRGDYYLAASRLVSYKKMDVIAGVFARMPGRRLVLAGDGPDMQKVLFAAGGASNIEIAGYVGGEELRDLMRGARGFIFAADEDFGIMPVEAQACGTPVIAYGHGGAIETVIEGRTGVFFESQTREAIAGAVERFEGVREAFDPLEIRGNAERFGHRRFRLEFREFVERHI